MSDTSSGMGDRGPGGPHTPESAAKPSGSPEAGTNQDSAPPPPPERPRPPFPWARLLYAIGFGFVAWAVFWVIVALLAPLHYITIAITGRVNEELQLMSLRAVRYLFELLGFITGARDEKPFPLGPFPMD
jgi:Domain of unknown function (DUF4389)